MTSHLAENELHPIDSGQSSNEFNETNGTTLSSDKLMSTLPDHLQHVETCSDTPTEQKRKSTKMKQPSIHYSSLFVKYCAPFSPTVSSEVSDISNAVQATLKLVERDEGNANDFYSIRLDLTIQPRGVTDVITISVDNILTLRHISTPDPPRVRLHARGGVPLGTLAFPNGPDACQAFILSLRNHTSFRLLTDPHVPGTLYALEAKPRMRRIAPSLMPLWFPQPSTEATNDVNRPLDGGNDDAFNELLSELNISSATATRHSRVMHRRREGYRGRAPRPVVQPTQLPGHNATMAVLSHFARITQAARDVGGQLAGLVAEERRGSATSQTSAAQAAREAALDIHAAVVSSTSEEQELPPYLTFDGERGRPVSYKTWKAGLDEEGHLVDARVTRYAIFAGGVDPLLRPVVWPFLLGLFPWSSSAGERTSILQQTRAEYAALKRRIELAQVRATTAEANTDTDRRYKGNNNLAWGSQDQELSDTDTFMLRVRDQITKDVIRTDRSLDIFRDEDAPALEMMATVLNIYANFNPAIAYCQGMSDFLAPIIQVIGTDDEALPFWCFQRLMQRMEANFRIDQSGMHAQLAMLKRVISIADTELAAYFEDTDPQYYACFRWIVVRFKRELPFDDVVNLWEILWSRQIAGDDLHIFVAAALLLAHRQNLLALRRGAFDSLLRYINDMSMRIDVDFAIREGELCFQRHGDAVRR